MGITGFLLRHRSAVAAGIVAVFAAAVPGLLLRRKLIENALQIRMVRINAGVHDADRAARVGGRGGLVLSGKTFLPARHFQIVAAFRRERGSVNCLLRYF